MGPAKPWLGLDVGGANLKAATADGFARQVAFPLWQDPDGLPAAIAELIHDSPAHTGLAVTMTGELADCFPTKAEGVAAIVTAVEQAASGEPVRYFSTRECFLNAQHAIERWQEVAAANWYALALACSDDGLLVDVGSTTVDVIRPGFRERPADDTSRLLAGELLYFGVGRTPVCAIVDHLPYRGQTCPAAAELFATTADVALLLKKRPPCDTAPTADGRPLTEPFASARIARLLCADTAQFNEYDAITASEYVLDRLTAKLRAAVENALRESNPAPKNITLSGEGAWLAEAALPPTAQGLETRKLADMIGAECSRCAPAWSVAKLGEAWGLS